MPRPEYGQMLRNRYEGGGFGEPDEMPRAELAQPTESSCQMNDCINNAGGVCASIPSIGSNGRCSMYEQEMNIEEGDEKKGKKIKGKMKGKKTVDDEE